MKVLVLKLSALGDVLASTPIFKLLKKEHPNSMISHLVMSQCSVITENNPNVDLQHVIDTIPSGNKLRDLYRLVKLWWVILRTKYDVAIILHRNPIFVIFCRLCGIRSIVGFSNKFKILYKYTNEFSMDGNRTLQEIKLLESAGLLSSKPQKLDFYIKEDRVDKEKCAILPTSFIAINVGGGNPHALGQNKFWSIDSYIDLIKRVSLPVVVLGSGESDSQLVKKIINEEISFINMVDKTNFYETAYVLKRSKLYLGNDSSLMYLAASIGTKTIGLYGPTSAISFLPLGADQNYIQGQASCSPCYSSLDGIKGKMYTCQNNLCMQSISVDQVLNKIKSVMNED